MDVPGHRAYLGTMRAIPLFTIFIKGARGGGSPRTRAGCSGRMEGHTLIIDCRGCRQAQSLAEQHCLKGALSLIAGGTANVREIVLDSNWQVHYGKEVVEILSRLADVSRFCHGLAFAQPLQDCSACPSNPRRVVSRVIDWLPRKAPELDTRTPRPSGGHARTCEQCVHDLRHNLDHVRHMLTEVEALIPGHHDQAVNVDDR